MGCMQQAGLQAAQRVLDQVHSMGYVIGDTKAANFMARYESELKSW